MYEYHDLLKEQPPLSELQKLAKLGKVSPAQLVNTKSQDFKKLQPDLSKMSEQEIADLIKANPRIMVRPILTDGKTLVTGFDEAKYGSIIK